MSGPRPVLTRLSVAAEPAAWREAGFQLDGDAVTVGPVTISLAGADAGKRITGWELSGLGSTELDGLPTGRSADAPPDTAAVVAHPNGVTQLDHVVAFSPDLDRTVAAIEAAGLDLRRVREGPTAAGARRQAFFRVGPLLEVIEHPPGTPAAEDLDAPTRFWGLAFVVRDLDESAAQLGPLLGEPRQAIQPGRRIATVRREAALGVPVALMSSED